MPSHVFGPTDSVADTRTIVGSAFTIPVMDKGMWYAYQLVVAKGNVVNAKECAGIIEVVTQDRNYQFAYGNGIGGATNGNNAAAEIIQCAIPIRPNTDVKVYVLDATVAKDVTVSIQYSANPSFCVVGKLLANPTNFRTLIGGGISANADTAADTEEAFTVSSKLERGTLTPEIDGRIYQVRYAGAGVVDAKANSAKIIFYIPNVSDPYEYAVGNGPGGATSSGPAPADVIDIPEGIPVQSKSTVVPKITSAEVVKTPVISMSYW